MSAVFYTIFYMFSFAVSFFTLIFCDAEKNGKKPWQPGEALPKDQKTRRRRPRRCSTTNPRCWRGCRRGWPTAAPSDTWTAIQTSLPSFFRIMKLWWWATGTSVRRRRRASECGCRSTACPPAFFPPPSAMLPEIYSQVLSEEWTSVPVPTVTHFFIPFPAGSVVDSDQVYLLKNRLLIGLLQAETEIDVLHKNDIVNGQIKPQSPRSEIFLTLLISRYYRYL